ncbi:MAG: hypothetical protein QM785_15040 [Pyrinomonadaceae bacterium]
MKKVGFVSLGCPKNLVDSEVMMGQLAASGYEITNNADEADTVVVNTCGFIESAKQESIDTILEATRWKSEGSASRNSCGLSCRTLSRRPDEGTAGS